ncbi:MAG: alpha/beta fold hydrolase [Chloroflexi bacterium]|nr:alpha/beta fold hydrolase [Chloroflexota bacterium]
MPTAQLNEIEINYEVHGAGTPLLLTHGYTASLEMWREQVTGLSAKYQVVIYDMRGHGKTTAPSDMNQYSLARDYVADKLALMDHLGIERAYVGGLSMGGMIAQEFALQHPERVKALLLSYTGPGAGAGRDPTQRAMFEQMRNMMATMARTRGMGAIVDAMRNSPMAKAMVGAGTDAMPEPVRRHIEGMRTMSVGGYLGGAKAMQEWAGTLERLSAINVPTLVLVGENDNLLGPSKAIHDAIKGSRFVLLRNSGHGTNMWRPDPFLAETLAFLTDVDAGKPVEGEFVVP